MVASALAITVGLATGSSGAAYEGRFVVAHPSPIFQEITRAAFMFLPSKGSPSIHFSTLERYSRDPGGDRSLLASYDLESGQVAAQTIGGALEVRSYAYSESLGRYVLGTSLDPKLLLYDPSTRQIETVFSGPGSNAFVHRLAVRGEHAYTILSRPSSPPIDGLIGNLKARIVAIRSGSFLSTSIDRFDGILKVNLRTGRFEVIPFTEGMTDGWGGVETVDPSGRIWFYRAYPVRRMWYDPAAGMRDRTLLGLERWTVESWDEWNGASYLVLTNARGEFKKVEADLTSLEILPTAAEPLSEDARVFLNSMRVDLYHSDPSTAALYFEPATSAFYLLDRSSNKFRQLGTFEFRQLQEMGLNDPLQEAASRWTHPALGEVEVLGVSPGSELVVWLRGRKAVGLLNLRDGSLALSDIPISNLSPADVTSLVAGSDGRLYGGGILTMSPLFKFDPTTNAAEILPSAVPNWEGQVNSMFAGWDGKIYGAAYPDSVIFRFDPLAPWAPGQSPTSNPVNLGPMGHYNQTRASRGVQDLDGFVWFQSITDYARPIAHALARADFAQRTLVVKTDLDDGIPQVRDLTVFDAHHLLLLGTRGGNPGIYLLNQRKFRIERRRDLDAPGSALANLTLGDGNDGRIFLAQGADLYRVGQNLSLTLIHRSPNPILRILAGSGDDVILIGKTYIEKISPDAGTQELWWNRADVPGGYVFKHSSWAPAVFHQGTLFVADEEKLLRFYPPPR